ncbi:MAG: hypothetical protein R3E60_00560 [Alphaproteobacteria bacterium]
MAKFVPSALALLRRGVLAAGLVFVDAMKELPAALILQLIIFLPLLCSILLC